MSLPHSVSSARSSRVILSSRRQTLSALLPPGGLGPLRSSCPAGVRYALVPLGDPPVRGNGGGQEAISLMQVLSGGKGAGGRERGGTGHHAGSGRFSEAFGSSRYRSPVSPGQEAVPTALPCSPMAGSSPWGAGPPCTRSDRFQSPAAGAFGQC